MISKKLIKVILSASSKERKDTVIEELLNHISLNYDYDNQKANHILEMLADSDAIVTINDVNLRFIIDNPNYLLYNSDKYVIRNIKIEAVDNIECTVRVSYEYKKKDEEDSELYSKSGTNISFIDFPNILLKEC